MSVDGGRRWVLAADADRLPADPPAAIRLLGPFDLFLQGRDRALLVPDAVRAKELWPTLGRPGGVLAAGEIVGSWRARRSGRTVTVTADLWAPAPPRLQAGIEEQAERLAAFRNARLSAVTVSA